MSLLGQLYLARWLVLVVAFAAYLANKYRKYRRLQAFPGPSSTGWSELLHICAILNKSAHHWYKAIGDRYGPIVRVGPNELNTSSPDLLAHMNAVRSPYTRGAWYYGSTRMEPGRDHIFSQLDETKHTKRRQQLASGYSGKENLSLEPDVDENVLQLLDLIRSKYLSTDTQSKPMDLGVKIQYFTLDVISKIGFGRTFGDLKADADLDNYISSARVGLSIMVYVAGLGLAPLLQWSPLAHLVGPSDKDKSGFGRMLAVARELIDSRLEKTSASRSDMLASFIRHGLPRDDIVTESLLQILAGSDTTATAIRATMLHLMTHHVVYRKLQAEIDAAVSSGQVASGRKVVSDETLKQLPYLHAVVREGLRIHPAITDVVPKVVPEGGDTVTIDGKEYFLPGGTLVGYNVLGLQHDKNLFGEDAEYFRPERWLLDEEVEADGQRLAAMRRTTEMIFGYGKYQCLGKPIAWLELRKVIFELLRHFDWSLATPEKPWRSTNYNGIYLQNEMWVSVTERANKGI